MGQLGDVYLWWIGLWSLVIKYFLLFWQPKGWWYLGKNWKNLNFEALTFTERGFKNQNKYFKILFWKYHITNLKSKGSGVPPKKSIASTDFWWKNTVWKVHLWVNPNLNLNPYRWTFSPFACGKDAVKIPNLRIFFFSLQCYVVQFLTPIFQLTTPLVLMRLLLMKWTLRTKAWSDPGRQ